MAVAKRKSPKRVAAAKKAAATRRRNASKSPVRRRRRTTKKKGFLSEFGGVEDKAAFRTLVSGTVGGTAYLIYEDQVDTASMTPERKGLLAVVGAYAIARLGKKPETAAGVVGAAAYDFFKVKGLLGDGAGVQTDRMNWADPLNNVPVSLSEDEMLYLSQGGDPNLLLSENNAEEQYLPNYAATYRY